MKDLFANRKTQLEDSLNLHQFFYDLEMEMAWIREHMTLANSEDLGTSLIGVQRLQKRHLVRMERIFALYLRDKLVFVCYDRAVFN